MHPSPRLCKLIQHFHSCAWLCIHLRGCVSSFVVVQTRASLCITPHPQLCMAAHAHAHSPSLMRHCTLVHLHARSHSQAASHSSTHTHLHTVSHAALLHFCTLTHCTPRNACTCVCTNRAMHAAPRVFIYSRAAQIQNSDGGGGGTTTTPPSYTPMYSSTMYSADPWDGGGGQQCPTGKRVPSGDPTL